MREYINRVKLVMKNKHITRRHYFEAERALRSPNLGPQAMSTYLNWVTPF